MSHIAYVFVTVNGRLAAGVELWDVRSPSGDDDKETKMWREALELFVNSPPTPDRIQPAVAPEVEHS